MQGRGSHPLPSPGLHDLAGPPVFFRGHKITPHMLISSAIFSPLRLEVGRPWCPVHESGQACVSLVTNRMAGLMLGTAEKMRFRQKR